MLNDRCIWLANLVERKFAPTKYFNPVIACCRISLFVLVLHWALIWSSIYFRFMSWHQNQLSAEQTLFDFDLCPENGLVVCVMRTWNSHWICNRTGTWHLPHRITATNLCQVLNRAVSQWALCQCCFAPAKCNFHWRSTRTWATNMMINHLAMRRHIFPKKEIRNESVE